MKNYKLLILFCLMFGISFGQELYDPDSILVGNRKQPEVFLVGCYHFAYYNLDGHKTEADKQVNVLSEERQKEMQELVKYIAQFKPTKIAIEADENTEKFMPDYRAYLQNERELKRDEREQIGFRLMEMFGLDTIYGIDANSTMQDLYNLRDSNTQMYLNEIFEEYDYQSDETIAKKYMQFYKNEDSIKLTTTLLEYFKHLNSDKMLERGYGAYLNGDFTLDDYHGVDALSLYWYSRNLRIYRNIQKITTSENDRILVIFGSGHIQILKQLFESSPEFKYVKFNAY